jgi:hypothetical protein
MVGLYLYSIYSMPCQVQCQSCRATGGASRLTQARRYRAADGILIMRRVLDHKQTTQVEAGADRESYVLAKCCSSFASYLSFFLSYISTGREKTFILRIFPAGAQFYL